MYLPELVKTSPRLKIIHPEFPEINKFIIRMIMSITTVSNSINKELCINKTSIYLIVCMNRHKFPCENMSLFQNKIF